MSFALLLTAQAGLWVAAFLARGRGLQRILFAAAALVPAALVWNAIEGGADRFGALRVTLEGLRFAEGTGEVRIGGDRNADQVLVQGLPASFLRVVRPGDGSKSLELRKSNAADSPYGVIAVGQRKVLAGAERPGPGGSICLQGKDGYCAGGTLGVREQWRETLVLDASGREVCRFPRRYLSNSLRLPSAKDLGPEARVFRLVAGKTSVRCLSPDAGRAGADERLLGVFFRSEDLELPLAAARSLFFLPLAEGVMVNGKTAPRTLEKVAPGASLSIFGFGLDETGARLRLRRSLTIHNDASSVLVAFGEPNIVDIPKDDLCAAYRHAGCPPQAESSGPASMLQSEEPLLSVTRPGAPLEGARLSFVSVGHLPGVEAFSAIRLVLDEDRVEVSTHRDARAYRMGEVAQLGEEAAQVVRFEQSKAPLGLPALVLGLLLPLALVRLVYLEPGEWLVVSCVETLMAIRLLVAVSGAQVDSSVALDGIVHKVLLESVLLVFVFHLSLRRIRDRPEYLLVVVAWLAAALASLRYAAGEFPSGMSQLLWTTAGLAAAGLLLQLIAGPKWRKWDSEAWFADSRWLRRAVVRSGSVFVLVRILAFFAGFKERLGTLFLISAVAVPFAAAWFGFFFAWLFRQPAWQERRAPAVVYAGALVFLAGVAYYISDSGSVLYLVPIAMYATCMCASTVGAAVLAWLAVDIVVVSGLLTIHLQGDLYKFSWAAGLLVAFLLAQLAAMLLRRRWIADWRAAFWWPLPLAVFLSGIVAVNGVFVTTDGAEEKIPEKREAIASYLKQRTSVHVNQFRIWRLMIPALIDQQGTRESEGVQESLEHMRVFAMPQDVFGRGFPALEPPGALRKSHMNDTLSAVHILSPFGLAGGFALVLLYCAIASIAWLEFRRRGAPFGDPLAASGVIAAWTLAGISVYMVLANLELVPFTGRNVYLLSARSTSDLVEGGLLLMLAMHWLVGRSPASRTGQS